ncbi:MAG: hypothetical protein LBR36_05320 [Bacteroidales bacterium]|nr:hypothetical protein [Bacteroidales bacterium]
MLLFGFALIALCVGVHAESGQGGYTAQAAWDPTKLGATVHLGNCIDASHYCIGYYHMCENGSGMCITVLYVPFGNVSPLPPGALDALPGMSCCIDTTCIPVGHKVLANTGNCNACETEYIGCFYNNGSSGFYRQCIALDE